MANETSRKNGTNGPTLSTKPAREGRGNEEVTMKQHTDSEPTEKAPPGDAHRLLDDDVAVVGVVAPPPLRDVVLPPPDFVPLTPTQVQSMLKPTRGQITNAGAMTREVESAGTYGEDFGPHAPSAAFLLALLRVAIAWSREAAVTSAWLRYAQSQQYLAWDIALRVTGGLRREFDRALERRPALAERYPNTRAFLGARQAAAARGAAARKARRRAAAKPPSGGGNGG